MVSKAALPYLTAILALWSGGLLSAANTTGATQTRVTASYARIPMSFESCFEAMCAEADSQAKFFSRVRPAAWLAKLNNAGTTLVYATHIAPGGQIWKIAV